MFLPLPAWRLQRLPPSPKAAGKQKAVLHGARSRSTNRRHGRTQTTRYASALVYMGPAAHTPLLSEMLGVLHRQVAAHSKPKVLPPPYGGEQRRKGKGLPYPSKGFRRRSPDPYGGAAVSIGGVETVTVQRLSVHGCDPTALRSEGFCGALERFHCDPYPQTHQPSFRTHRGPFRDELRV